MRMQTASVAVLAGCLLASVVGCTTQHVFEFKHPDSGNPVEDTPVVLSSTHRIYSFLDLRHYTSETGQPVVTEGKTDKTGRVILGLPSDLGISYVQLDGKWFSYQPSSAWQPMLTQQEYVDRAEKPAVEGGRPLVRMETK
jgi:hypothetical protein